MVQVNASRSSSGIAPAPQSAPPFSIEMIVASTAFINPKTKEKVFRLDEIRFSVIHKNPDLNNAATLAQFKAVVAKKLEGAVSDEALDRALAFGGVIREALAHGGGSVTVVDIMVAQAKAVAAANPPPTPRLKAVPSRQGPTPPPAKPQPKTDALVPAPKVFSKIEWERKTQIVQRQTYEKAKALVEGKISQLQAGEQTPALALRLAKLHSLSKNLDAAARLMLRGPVAPPDEFEARSGDRAANALYCVAYVMATADAKNAKVSDYEIRHYGSEENARADLARTAAFHVFGLTPGDPLSTVGFRDPDPVADVLQ